MLSQLAIAVTLSLQAKEQLKLSGKKYPKPSQQR